MTIDAIADELALRALSARYAAGLDQRDAAVFITAFLPDAELMFHRDARSAEPDTVRRGHAELRLVPERLDRYAETFHFVGQTEYDVDGAGATGRVHCMAHHRSDETGEDGTDYVMFLVYDDVYRPDGEGRWRIARRVGRIHWTETRPTNPVGT
jgi:hypothetical protein